MRVIRANEFENTFTDVPKTSPSMKCSLEKRMTMPRRNTNTPHMANISQERYGVSVRFSFCLFLMLKILERPVMLQPNISVVINVEIAWMAYAWEMNGWSILAPKFPMK